jgi:hypothetical protein
LSQEQYLKACNGRGHKIPPITTKISYSVTTEIFQGCAGNYTPVDWSNEELRETKRIKVDFPAG